MYQKHTLLLLLFISIVSIGFSQKKAPIDIDNIAKNELSDAEIQKYICNIADSLAISNNHKEAVVYYSMILPYIKDIGFKSLVLASRNACYYYLSQYGDILENFREPLKYFNSVEDWSYVAYLYSVAGLAYLKLGMLDSANLLFYKALPIVEDHGTLTDKSDLYYNISSIFRALKEYDKALTFYFKSSAISYQLGDSVHIPSSLNSIATSYYQMKNYDSALFYYEKALNFYDLIDTDLDIGSTYDGLGRVYLQSGNLNESKFYLLKAYNYNNKKGYKRAAAVNLNNLSIVFRDRNQYDSAFYYIKEALAMNKKSKNFLHERDNLQRLATYYFEVKDYKNAYLYGVKYGVLRDSILNKKLSDKIANLRVKYEDEKKDKEITMQKLELETRQNQIEQQKVKQSIFFLGLVFIIIIFVVIVLYRRRLQITKLLQVEQENEFKLKDAKSETEKIERKRLANMLHDNIAHIISMSQRQINNHIDKVIQEDVKNNLIKIEDNLLLAGRMTKVASYELEMSYIFGKNIVDQIQDYINRIKHSHSPEINFDYSDKGKFEYLNDEINENIFSVFQEMLGNAIKYSQSDVIRITLLFDDGKTVLQVIDNGIGFNYDEVRHGLGYKNMKERAEKLNGSFSFESEKGFGTKLRFEV